MVLLLLLLGTAPAPVLAAAPVIDGVAVFPDTSIWNTPVDRLPVAADSSAFVATIGADRTLRADFGAGTWDGGPIGIPFATVSGTQQTVPIEFYYADESDPGPYPIPPVAARVGERPTTSSCWTAITVLYEVFDAKSSPTGAGTQGRGRSSISGQHAPPGILDLRRRLPACRSCRGWSLDESLGEITHAIRFTAPETRRPMSGPPSFCLVPHRTPLSADGQRFRLKADFDLSGYPPQTGDPPGAQDLRDVLADRVVLVPVGRTTPAGRRDLRELRQVPGSAFEAVDVSSLVVDPDSGEARGTGPGPFPGHAAPLDHDGDGLFEDVNGNDRPDFADVVLLFNHADLVARSGWEPYYDFNNNSRFDFADIVVLFGGL